MAAHPVEASDFNFHRPDHMQDPFGFYAEMREQCPIGRSEQLGGFYFVTGYDDAKRVLGEFRTFSSAQGTALPKQPVDLIPEDLDPPEQTKFRRILNPMFTPEYVERFRSKLQLLVDGLIDGFVEHGTAELGEDLIRPTLHQTVLPFLGVPLGDQAMISAKIDFLVRRRGHEPEQAMVVGGEIAAYLIGLAAARRAAPAPMDDILQTLIGSSVDGKPLSDDEIFRILFIILFGGLDTTSASVSEALLHFARHPGDADRLRHGEVAWETAIEEFVRFTSPVQSLRRTVVRETELAGQRLCPGDYVMTMSGAGNRDPRRFERPNEIVIDRKMEEHIAFGSGAHVCLGRNFARLAMRVLLETVLKRLPDFRVADDFVPEYGVGEARGMKALPITFTPGPRSAV